MALRYGYFDSDIIGTDEEGMPIFDRAETSDLFALLFASLVSDGVLAQPGDCFQVRSGGNGLTLNVQPGFGMVRGQFAYNDEVMPLTIEAAPQTYSRIDRVILRCNYLERLMEILVKTGEEAPNPVPPDLLRPAAGDYYELCLANITLMPGQQVITDSNVTDTRANSAVCGYITQLIDHLDTAAFYEQFNAFYAEFVEKSEMSYDDFLQQLTEYLEQFKPDAEKKVNDIVSALSDFAEQTQSAFEDWFANIRDKLSEDPAGQLQNEVEALAQAAFNRYYGLANQTTEFMPDGSIVQTNGEATITTTFGYDAEGHRQIRQVLTVGGSGDTYTKLTTVYEATADENKRIVEEYTGTSAGGIYDPGTGTWTFKLPVAGMETLGGIKVGEGLAISEDGTLSVDTGAAEEETVRILGERLVDFDPKEVTDMFDDGGEE